MNEELSKIREEFISKANNFELEFKKFHQDSVRKACKQGARDASNAPRGLVETNQPFEKTIFSSYAAQITELSVDFMGMLNRIKQDFVQTISEDLSLIQQKGLSQELQKLTNDRNRELEAVEDKYHDDLEILEQDPAYNLAKQTYDDIDDDFDEMAEILGRRETDKKFQINGYLYILTLFILGIAEVLATYHSFLHFEEPAVTTFIWAFFNGLILSISAHFIGFKLAEGRAIKSERNKAIFWMSFVFLVLVALAAVRIVNVSNEKLLIPGFFTFLFFSALIVMVGSLLSSFTHDSNPAFDRLIKKRTKAKQELDEIEKAKFVEKKALHEQLQKTEMAINNKFNAIELSLHKQEEKLRHQYHDSVTLYDEMLQGLKNIEQMILSYFYNCLTEYQSSFANNYKSAQIKFKANGYNVPVAFRNMQELDQQKNKGLWHYNPN